MMEHLILDGWFALMLMPSKAACLAHSHQEALANAILVLYFSVPTLKEQLGIKPVTF